MKNTNRVSELSNTGSLERMGTPPIISEREKLMSLQSEPTFRLQPMSLKVYKFNVKKPEYMTVRLVVDF